MKRPPPPPGMVPDVVDPPKSVEALFYEDLLRMAHSYGADGGLTAPIALRAMAGAFAQLLLDNIKPEYWEAYIDSAGTEIRGRLHRDRKDDGIGPPQGRG